MAAGVLSKTEAPPFDIMGMLLGGRGYASSWFQNRDKLRMLDIAQQKELADRQAYTKGVLASPELTAQIQNPYDRRANWNLWGQLASGPESMVPFANQQTNQATGAIYDREQAKFQADLSAANVKLSADQQIRVQMEQRQAEKAQQAAFFKYLFSPEQGSGLPPAQSQLQRDWVGKQLGIEAPEGYSIAAGGNGFEPTFGSPVHEKMMEEGTAVTNLINNADQLLAMATTGQGDVNKWGEIRGHMLLDLKRAETLGTLDQGVSDFFNQIVPDYYGAWGPELNNKVNDMLTTSIKLWKSKLGDVATKYRVPIQRFDKESPFKPKRLSPDEEAAQFPGNPVATPAPQVP